MTKSRWVGVLVAYHLAYCERFFIDLTEPRLPGSVGRRGIDIFGFE